MSQVSGNQELSWETETPRIRGGEAKHMCYLARKKVVQSNLAHMEKERKPSPEVLSRALELAERKTQSMLQYRNSFENRVGLILSFSSVVVVAAVGLTSDYFNDGRLTCPQRFLALAALVLMILALFFLVASMKSFKGWIDAPSWEDTYSDACLFQEEGDYVSQGMSDMKRAFDCNELFMEKRGRLFEHGLWFLLAGIFLFAAVVMASSIR